MSNFPRYAIYFAPATGAALARFGAEHLGYDAWTGEDVAFPAATFGTIPDWRDLSSDPRKYGFHATLKAPFGLAEGIGESEIRIACAAFAATPRAIPMIRPIVDAISGFIAVIPADTTAELLALAADCVSAFEPFRAAMTPEDRARRNPERLPPRQVDYLDRWGYPYVMDEFRFHMTLTGRLEPERREGVLAVLRERFAALRLEWLAIDRIALFRQSDPTARFRIVDFWPLAGNSSVPS